MLRSVPSRWARTGFLIGLGIAALDLLEWRGAVFQSWSTSGGLAENVGYFIGAAFTAAIAGGLLGGIKDYFFPSPNIDDYDANDARFNRTGRILRALNVTWKIVWGCIELLIIAYVFSRISNRDTTLIVAVLGLIYATMRSMLIGKFMADMNVWSALDKQFYEVKYAIGMNVEKPDSTEAIAKIQTNLWIVLAFMALVSLICLFQIFSTI